MPINVHYRLLRQNMFKVVDNGEYNNKITKNRNILPFPKKFINFWGSRSMLYVEKQKVKKKKLNFFSNFFWVVKSVLSVVYTNTL